METPDRMLKQSIFPFRGKILDCQDVLPWCPPEKSGKLSLVSKLHSIFSRFYSRTPLNGHSLNTDTSLLRTVSFVPPVKRALTFSLN